MLGTGIITLVLVAQVTAHPPLYTLNDGDVADGMLYQSDMVLSEEQWEALRTRKAYDKEEARWTDGEDGYPLVPYIFLDSVLRDDVEAGLDHWMEHTCINFEETTDTDRPHLQFQVGTGGCRSSIGMVYWKNGQTVSLADSCNSFGTVVHEVGHAIGFWHEQSRSDRDDYVTILFENVRDGENYRKAFEKEADNNYSIPYDYSSIMHYRMDLFSKNDFPTIVTLDPLAQEFLGQKKGLSHRDILLANKMYNCIGKWLAKCGISSDPCLNEGYTGKDCSCVCRPGTTGSNCENIVDDYYAHLRNSRSEKITTEKTITVETPMDSDTKFVKWIVPPACHMAKVTFTSAELRNDNCRWQYFNVRTNAEDMMGYKMCPNDVTAGYTLTSDTGIIINMINRVRYGSGKWTLWAADVIFEHLPGCSVPIPCTKQAQLQVLQKGESVTITSPNFPSEYAAANCNWVIMTAVKKTTVSMTCEHFSLDDKDILKINRQIFTKDSTISKRKLTIKFRSRKRTSGPGFRCTVVAN